MREKGYAATSLPAVEVDAVDGWPACLFLLRPHLTPTMLPSQSRPPAQACAARSAAFLLVKFTNADLVLDTCTIDRISDGDRNGSACTTLVLMLSSVAVDGSGVKKRD